MSEEEMNNSEVIVTLPTTTGTIVPQSITNQLATSSPPYAAAPPPAGATHLPEKKKRGRPRKYSQDQSVTITKALSPKPISSVVPPVIDFSTGKSGKIRPPEKQEHQPIPEKVEPLGNKDYLLLLKFESFDQTVSRF